MAKGRRFFILGPAAPRGESVIIGELLIGENFLGGACDQTMSRNVVRSPYDGHVVGSATEGGFPELEAAIEAADGAFQSWRHSSRDDRITLLRSIAKLVRERKDELSELLVHEIAKPISFARAEVDRLALTFDESADLVSIYGFEAMPLDMDPRGKGHTCMVERFPLGAIFCMAPYNWPFNLVAQKIGPALATGNTLVIKTSPLAPLSTMELVKLIKEAGAPPGLVNSWNGADKHVSAALKHPSVKMLSFTGSARVGWMLKAQTPDKRVLLELGGNAMAIVAPDADLDWAAKRIVSGGYGYAGQICISIQHVLVQASLYEGFRERLIELTGQCPSGDPALESTICGPLISVEAAQKVRGMIEEAVSKGAKILAGGLGTGNFIPPTLLEDVPSGVALSTEEVFGPVMTLSSYQTLEDAIARVNQAKYGIQTGLFSFDIRTIQKAFRELETGGLIVNDYPTLRFDNIPYGGVKQSGFGREGVRYAMDEMTEPKALITRPF